ncbi:PE domain-containing protein [Mycobacterium sp.]|uniref:PE domain-containing protein n=1 Tax=Mycobacterium sp. TaxID=1785 RepID=UPI003A89736E
MITAAAANVAGLHTALAEANATALGRTTGVVAAAADKVSAAAAFTGPLAAATPLESLINQIQAFFIPPPPAPTPRTSSTRSPRTSTRSTRCR